MWRDVEGRGRSQMQHNSSRLVQPEGKWSELAALSFGRRGVVPESATGTSTANLEV